MRAWRLVCSALVALILAAVAAGAAAAAAPYVQIAGSPFDAGTRSLWSAAFSPTGAFFATGNFFSDSVTMFSVSPTTGGLSALGQTNVPSNPNQLAFARSSGATVLGVVGDADASLFSVSASGVLTQLGSTQSVPSGSTALAFNSAGTRLAVATFSGVQMYGVSGAGLTPLDFASLSGSETSIAFDPAGKLLAISLQNANQIQMFSVGSTGTLTSVGTPTPTGNQPDAIAFSPNGKLLVAANQGDGTVSVFTVASSGALAALGTPAPSGQSPDSLAFSSSGNLLAVSNYVGNSVSLFSVGSGGALVPVSGSPFPTGLGSRPDAVSFSPTGLVGVPRWNGGVSIFAPAAPTAQISSPSGRRTFARGSSVPTRFSCADSALGPGIASCVDSGGSHSPAGRLSTATLGAQTYSAMARSKDGQSGVAVFRYFVANAPSVKISAPRSGKTYRLRAHVATKFACHEGAGAPGLSTCADSNGVRSGDGHLNTSHYGLWHYVVTAVSRDTLVVRRSITFRVAAPPSVSIASPVAGAHLARGARVVAAFSCTDGLGGAGIKSCHGPVRSGRPIDTSKPGRHRFTVIARSKDGLRARMTVSYFVA